MSPYTYDFYKTLTLSGKPFGQKLLDMSDSGYRGTDEHGNQWHKARVKEWYIAKNKEGKWGMIGCGITWFLNFVTGSGSWGFNPINIEDYAYHPIHKCYYLKNNKWMFDYKLIINMDYDICYEKELINDSSIRNNWPDPICNDIPREYIKFKY